MFAQKEFPGAESSSGPLDNKNARQHAVRKNVGHTSIKKDIIMFIMISMLDYRQQWAATLHYATWPITVSVAFFFSLQNVCSVSCVIIPLH